MKTFLILVALTLAFVCHGQTSGTPASTQPRMWPGNIWNDISNEVDRSGTQLTNVLFELVDDFDWSHKSNDNKIKVQVKRQVYDNQDILSTWTVNDQFSIDLSRNATEFSLPIIPSATLPLNFNFGVGGRLQVNHIRQVPSASFSRLPDIHELHRKALEEAAIYEKKNRRIYEIDPSARPRLIKPFNSLANVYRIPWTKEGLRKIDSGDIVSYSASGHVLIGLEGGFVPVKLVKSVDISVGVGVQAIVRGEFRITVLKENNRYARVKLTKVRSSSLGITVGAETGDIETYEGFLIFEGKELETRVLQNDITVVPFKFAANIEHKRQDDLGFRFDLEDEQAEEAFEKAMRGNFKFAEDISRTNKAVTHILTRDSFEKKKSKTSKLGMNWFLQVKMNKEKKDLWVHLIKPDGTRDIFKSSFQLSRSWSSVWGSGEKKNFLFTTVFDETAYLKNEEDSFQLVTEVLYEDVRTRGKEMHRYIRDVETVVGDDSVLPDLPIMVPRSRSNGFKQAKYKRSSFYFGQFISQKQVLKFLMTDPDKAWEIAVRSFGYLKDKSVKKGKVRRFYKHWMKLQKKFKLEMTSQQMIDALIDLRSLFRYHGRAVHALKAILASLDGEEIDYFVTASNKSFGRVQYRGRVTTNAERLLQYADESIDFENYVNNTRSNPEAQIKDLHVEHQEDQSLKITFVSPKGPNFVFLKIMRTSAWKRIKIMQELIYVNKERFKEGKNVWIIDPMSKDPLDQAIYESFKTTDFYTFQISTSPDRLTWGRVSSKRFKFTLLEDEEGDEEEEEKP